ncbi:hypothetical protein G6F56_000968 [Rhizopus delemar]|uniref:Uncharacterized protein n=1 Tax=Rhizopus stolonifer TaxID=4846 RepID=A0A367KR14_RHIST|nr:hypothetical protein G6F56_000968 [Rhizopus delemar]RCI04302.1 hypothetical protein CU098_012342 [Rhizopus stolonifer]
MTTPENQIIFLDLTGNRSPPQQNTQDENVALPSTHDNAETILYSFVENSPSVADLLWSKKKSGQDEFLTLTPETEDDMILQDSEIQSTHDNYF